MLVDDTVVLLGILTLGRALLERIFILIQASLEYTHVLAYDIASTIIGILALGVLTHMDNFHPRFCHLLQTAAGISILPRLRR